MAEKQSPKSRYWADVREPLFDLVKALENKIDRERRQELEARASGTTSWLLGHIRVIRQTYLVLETLARDRKELALPLESAVVIAPLARVILESAMTVLFIFEKPAERFPAFWRATWAAIRKQYSEENALHGSEQSWIPWLEKLAKERDQWARLLEEHGTPLSADELSGAKQIPYWPNPGKMNQRCCEGTTKQLLEYLGARFYGRLSSMTHLSGAGFLAQSSVFLMDDETKQKKNFSNQFLDAMALMLLFASVLILTIVPESSLAERAINLWEIASGGDSGDLYDQELKPLLVALLA